MTFETHYAPEAVSRDEVNALPGATVLEFGTNWCGFCRAAQPVIEQAMAQGVAPHAVRHLKVEDGPGRPLGRSFRVKLWPTLIFLKDGQEVDRVVRPQGSGEVSERLARLLAG